MPRWWPGQQPEEETSGQKAERERVARKREAERAWRAENPERVRQYSRDRRARQRAEADFQRRARDNAEEKREAYQAFLRRYGDAGGRLVRNPTPEQVQHWWDGPGKSRRWVGQPTPPKGQHVRSSGRPRRTGESMADLVGWPGGGPPEPDPPQEQPKRPIQLPPAKSSEPDTGGGNDNDAGKGIWKKQW